MQHVASFSLGVPILLLVVGQLSGVAREMDLADIASDGRQPFVLWMLDSGRVPTMGRFNFVHTGNTVLLGATLAFVGLHPADVARWTLVLLVATFWLVLPVIEVTEYGLTTDGRPRAYSYWLHAGLVAVALAVVGWFPPIVVAGGSIQLRPVAAVGYAGLLGVGCYAYLSRLQTELRRTSAAFDL